jgi:hypothetical protein
MSDPGWCGTPCPDPTSSCSSDADCGTGWICDPKPCCSNATACTLGCTDGSQCPLSGEACVAGRCAPQICSDGDLCPTNSTCMFQGGALSGECDPKSCTTDADCNGYCVDGFCEDRLGLCYAPAP